MRTEGQTPVEKEAVMNVLSLFKEVEFEVDPLETLIQEGEIEDEASVAEFSAEKRLLVSESQFPDQSVYTLEKQLSSLRESLDRIQFYLSDVDDLIQLKISSRQS
jgi:hypothetical protein